MHINHLHVQAQLLAEMDEEFGISNLVEEEFGSLSRPRQPVRNLMKITPCIFYITLLSKSHLIWTFHHLNQKAFLLDLSVHVHLYLLVTSKIFLFSHYLKKFVFFQF